MPKTRFFTWYRLVPLVVVFVFGFISLVYSCAPAAFFKPFYPIDYEAYVKQSSISHNLDPYLVCAVIKSESNWDPEAESNQGAQGLMQLMPETASDLGVKNAYDPKDNIMGGAKYLGQLMEMFNGDMTKTIAAYNAGPGSVQQYGGVPPYQETQNYVDKVLGYYQENKGIQA